MLLRYRAVVLARPAVEMLVQLLPLSVEYCQAPCPAVAALAVMAMPTRVSPSRSENEAPKRLATVSPAGVVVSSVTAAREGLPLATGALLTSSWYSQTRFFDGSVGRLGELAELLKLFVARGAFELP